MGHCKLVNLYSGEVLYEAEEEISSIYFPLDCIVSLLFESLNGKSAEIAPNRE
jgi:hypothetical protein